MIPQQCVYGAQLTKINRQDPLGLRDFINVDDLVKAHLDALGYLAKGGAYRGEKNEQA